MTLEATNRAQAPTTPDSDFKRLGELFALPEGAVVEAPALFPGLTSEAVVLTVVKATQSSIKFRATLFGVFLFTKILNKNPDGGFQWM